MEAALWGHLSIAEYLIANGAIRDLEDCNGMTASDLTTPLTRNRNERKRLSIVGEKPSDANDRRRIIGIRLNPQNSLTSQMDGLAVSLPPHTSGKYVQSSNSIGHNIAYYEHVSDYNIPTQSKTIARLDWGSLFSVVSAISGFSHEEHPCPVLNNLTGTKEWKRFASYGDFLYHLTMKTAGIPSASMHAMRKSN